VKELLEQGVDLADLRSYFSDEKNFPPAPRDDIWAGIAPSRERQRVSYCIDDCRTRAGF